MGSLQARNNPMTLFKCALTPRLILQQMGHWELGNGQWGFEEG
jgi:hypothetical protein